MAEENQNNSTQNSTASTGAAASADFNPVNTALNSAEPMLEASSTGAGLAAAKPVNPPVVQPKKPKTEKQIARERERRRRRRQKKQAEVKSLGQTKKLAPGQDVPLIVGDSEKSANLRAPADAKLVEETFPEPVVEPEEVVIEEESALPAPPEVLNLPPVEPEIENIPEPVEKPELNYPEPPVIHDEEVIAPPTPEPLEESQQIFEESPDLDETPSYENEPVMVEPQPEVISQTETTALPEHEVNLEQANQDKARELHQALLEEDEGLEELPVKQGLMGRFFDMLAHLIQGKKASGLPENMAKPAEEAPVIAQPEPQVEVQQEEQPEVEEREETVITALDDDLPDHSNRAAIGGIVWTVVKFLIVIVLIIGAFWIGSSLKLVDRIGGLFVPSTTNNQEPLAVGDNSQVVTDENLLRTLGFRTAQLMGQNLGNNRDLTYNVFYNANYFGKLMDPIFYGQTGISAAVYYGFGREVDFARNRFIYYVHYLSQVVNANTVKIDDVLKSNPRRDLALNNYLKESQEIFDTGNTLRKEINVQIDDLKISLNSLTPDKSKYETDFFASMDNYDGEKATDLLNQFIGSAQTEAELKAKTAALSRLSQNYESELVKLKLRIDAVNTNKDALVSGVTVTDTPGGGLNLIRQ